MLWFPEPKTHIQDGRPGWSLQARHSDLQEKDLEFRESSSLASSKQACPLSRGKQDLMQNYVVHSRDELPDISGLPAK